MSVNNVLMTIDFSQLILLVILSLILTVVGYLFVPIIFCIINKPMTEKKIKIISAINAICIWILFQIVIISNGGRIAASGAIFIWPWVGYIIMKKRLLIKPEECIDEENVEPTDNQHIQTRVSNKRKSRQRTQEKVKKIVMSALFCALAYVTMFVFHIRVGGFLTFDAKDAIITLSGLLFGPLSSFAISFTVAFIEMISVSVTGWWGFLMNFLASATFSCTAAVIYKYKHNIKGAIVGLISAIFTTTAVMVVLNLFITPLYTGSTTAAIATMIPTLLFPFNLTKAVMNAALVLLLYKPISRTMKATGIAKLSEIKPQEMTVEQKKKRRRTNIGVAITGVLFVAASIVVFVVVLGGKIAFFK